MPKTVVATEGSTLCQLAIAEGHLNCKKTREVDANKKYIGKPLKGGEEIVIPDYKPPFLKKAMDGIAKFIKKNAPPVNIRFVRGEHDNKDFASDDPVPKLHVSNYVTNKAGADGKKTFPTGFGYNEHAHADEDAFRIEVTDPAAGGSVNVKLEALRPQYRQDGTVSGHIPFTGVSEADRRKIDAVECKALPGAPKAFRSRYLRLVTNTKDHDELNATKQGLLIADLVDDNDEQVEIVSQKVRASYVVATCPCSPKCTAVAERYIDPFTKKVRLAVHILKKPADGQPVITTDNARKRILKFVRQYYAQAEMSVRFVPSPGDAGKPFIREVPAPANMFMIAEDGTGAKAQGGKRIKVKVKIDAEEKEVSLTTDANDLPFDTATKLAAAINLAFPAAKPEDPPAARASKNQPLRGNTDGSADVLVGDLTKQAVVLTVVDDEDANHKIKVARLTSVEIPDFDGNHSWIGTPEERLVVKNYNSGTDRIDLFIVGDLKGAWGEAFRPRIVSGEPAAERPGDELMNSILVGTTGMEGVKYQSTLCHELAHVLMDMGSHLTVKTEILGADTETGEDESPVNGPKRVSAWPLEFNDTAHTSLNPVQALRSNNTGVLDAV